MLTNLFILGFCSLMSWLLYRFPLQKAKTPDEYRKLLLFFGVLCGFVFFNGFLAYLGMGGLQLASSATPVVKLKALEGKKSGDGILLVGKVSDSNVFILGDYVAYLDESHLWSPMELWIDLGDGKIAIDNDNYQATNWPIDASGYSYLPVAQSVTVVGYLEKSVGISSGNDFQTIRADIVFAGEHADFVARARGKLILPMLMIFANAFVMIVIVFLPIRDCLDGIKGKKES